MVSTVVGDQTGSPCIAYLFALLWHDDHLETLNITLSSCTDFICPRHLTKELYICMCRLNSQLIEPMSLFLVHTEYFFSHTGRNIKECCKDDFVVALPGWRLHTKKYIVMMIEQ